MGDQETKAAGEVVRRKTLGDAHVDRSIANATPFNREFQDMITRHNWGEVWTRPGLDHRSRRILVLGTTLALGRFEEFQLHVRSWLRDGLPLSGIKEILLQQMIYCGMPIANTGFQAAAKVVEELRQEGIEIVGEGE